MEDILRELFITGIIKDPFIKAILSQIKTIASELNITEINELTNYLEEDCNRKEISTLLNYLNEQVNVIIDEYQDEIINPKKKKSEQIDLDDLVSYIQAEDVQKRRKKNRRKKKQDVVTIANNDMEIEEFKTSLLVDSRMADNVRKIKPVITSEWLIKVKKSVI
jgi:hypothetical protein